MTNTTANKDAEAPGGSDIMSHLEMKPVLAFAYAKSVSCALALTDDDEAAFLLHRKTPPKKLRSVLRDEAEEKGVALATKVFFGRVRINASNLVTITLNREPPGAKWQKALRIPLRKAGYPDFVITSDASVETESDQEDEAGDAPDDSGRRLGKRIPRELVQKLRELVKQAPLLVAHAPARKDHIRRLAARAIDMVKVGDARQATNAVNELDAALRAIPDQEKARTARIRLAAKSSAQALDKVGRALAAKAGTLHRQAEGGQAEDGAAIAAFFRTRISPAIRTLEQSGLGEQLDALAKTDDMIERDRLVARTLASIGSLERSLGADPVFPGPGENPFAAMNIARTNAAMLRILKARLQPFAAPG